MARRRHGRAALVSVALANAAIGGLVSEATGTEAGAADSRAVTLLQLATDFLDGKEPVALVRTRGAKIDAAFASTGNHRFEIDGLAADGSQAFVATDPKAVSPDSLTLVPASGVWLKLDMLAQRFGAPRRLPALPGHAWQYRFAIDEDRSVVAELSGDPAGSASRVIKLRALRER